MSPRKRVILFLTFYSLCVEGNNTCNPTGPKGPCCEHYKWNDEIGKCTACPDGYSGEMCNERCPLPAYGFGCQSTCACPNKLCHFVTGCPATTGTTMKKEQTFTMESHSISSDASYLVTSTPKGLSTVDDKNDIGTRIRNIRGLTERQRHILIAIITLSALIIFGFSIYFRFCLPKYCLRYFKRCRHNRGIRDEAIELA